jgi:hypothetical protein
MNGLGKSYPRMSYIKDTACISGLQEKLDTFLKTHIYMFDCDDHHHVHIYMRRLHNNCIYMILTSIVYVL